MIIVKRRGHTEKFDQRKLYASIYSACMAAQMTEKACEEYAKLVTEKVKKDLKKKQSTDSKTIFKLAIKHLRKKSKDAAFLYETHRDVS